MKGLAVALPIPTFLPTLGGAEIGLHNIASNLVKQGHRPVVITAYTHVRRLREKGWKLPYPVVAYPPRLLTWRRTRPRLGRVLLNLYHRWLQFRHRFDVWHATFGYPVGVSVVEFCRAAGLPHLVRCVGEDIQINHAVAYGMRLDPAVDEDIRRWLPRADLLVAITASIEKEYRDIGCDEGQIARIPNGVELERFRSHEVKADLHRTLELEEGRYIFLAVGRLHPKKNFTQLIEAAKELKRRATTPFAVVIVGANVRQLGKEVESAGLVDSVYLLEPSQDSASSAVLELPSDQILDCYRSADCFVMPSLVEAFGIVTIEAMAAGLPVIAADSPGCRDVIRGGKDGILYAGETRQLADAMERVLGDRRLQEELRDKSKARVKDFDWPSVVRRYTRAYEALIEAKSSPLGH